MYILFINSVGYVLFMTELESKFMNNNSDKKIYLFFLLKLIIIVIIIVIKIIYKKTANPWVQPDPTRSMWIGLHRCDELGWDGFFLTHHGKLGRKILLIWPNLTHAHPITSLIIYSTWIVLPHSIIWWKYPICYWEFLRRSPLVFLTEWPFHALLYGANIQYVIENFLECPP